MPKFRQNEWSTRLFADFASGDRAFSDSYVGFHGLSGTTGGAVIDINTGSAGSSKLLTARNAVDAFPDDGIGKRLFPNTALGDLPGNDEAGDGIGLPPGNPTITVGAPSTIGTLQTIGDQDFYAIHLDAGVLYQIGLYGTASGPNGVPLADAYIELYDSNGNKIDVADGGGETPGGELYGLDAMLTVEVQVSGTYYINARAFDQDDSNGGTGDGVGDYELFARISTYDPYYSTFSPLYSIDWGTQVNKMHQSVRNPDGNEGPRNTGNPQGNLNYSDATALQALATAQGKGDITGKNVITVYFAKAGEVYIDDDPTTPGTTDSMVAKGFEDWEIAAYKYAFAAYEKVADIVYLVVDNVYDVLTHTAAADFTFIVYEGTSGAVGPSLLGRMSPPDTDNEGQSEFNGNDIRWTPEGVAPGGFSFTTLIHEMGHGHGLAHPHDNGGHSGIMHGVEAEGVAFDYTNGDYDLNQSVYTMMSYEDGWQKSPYGQAASTDPYGWLKGLMAFDIAAIQDKYGVNENTATGDNIYVLEDTNHGTTFDANNNIIQFASGFESIWDAGGIDTISYVGSRDVNIDLRPATLKYEYGGGGWVSYATGVYGGYTIANGVTIENAIGGGGNDTLTGNSANNILNGGGGNDRLLAGAGVDQLIGGDGDDVLYFGADYTTADIGSAGAGRDAVVLQGNYTVTLSGSSLTGMESISLQSGANTTFGDTANNFYDFNITTTDSLVTAGQQLIVNAQSLRAGEDFAFDGSAEHDGRFLVYGGHGVDNLKGGDGVDVFFFEGQRWSAGDKVDGGAGRDAMVISAGSGLTHIEFAADSLTNIESISLNNKFATDPSQKPSYELVLHNGNVAPGGTLIVNGSSIAAGQVVNIDGHGVHDGNLILFGGGGNDVVTGGDGADLVVGGGGADALTGGAGADTFRYDSVSDSAVGASDLIGDFQAFGTDRIDLSRIDANELLAGDQAFTWIGASAFSGSAGQLRVRDDGGFRYVEGDTNGDGNADFSIAFYQTAAPQVQADFVL
jgi:serralysin